MKPKMVRLTPELEAWIAEEAKERGVSEADVIRMALIEAKRKAT